MSITIRGGGPLVATGTGLVSVTASGAWQPQAGDRLIIVHGNDYFALSNMSTPTVGGSTSGVGTITNGTADAGTNLAHGKSYYYDAGSTGDLTIAAVETGLADEDKVLSVYVLGGADLGVAPIAANNADASFTTTNQRVCNGVTPAASDDLLIVHTNDGGGASSAPYTAPAGMTEQYDSSGGMGTSGAVQQLASASPTGTKSFTVANTIASYVTLTIAVKTAAASTPISVSDTGSAADALATAAAASATDTASVADTVAVAASAPLGDTATAVDGLTVVVQLALGDAGAALDTVSPAITVALFDSGSGADSATGTDDSNVQKSLADVGHAADRLRVAIMRPDTGVILRPDLGVTERP